MAQKREKEESELKVPEKLICNTPIPAAPPKLSNTDNRSPGISDPSPDKAVHTISSGSDNAMSCSVTSDLISDSPPQQAVAAGSDPKARAKICGTSGVDKRRSCSTTVVETSDLSANPYDSTRQTAATEVSRRLVNRCAGCKRKVGLTGFRCRCGEMFCSEHRYSDRHDCSFDYKAAGREAIRRENPVVRAAKILKV